MPWSESTDAGDLELSREPARRRPLFRSSLELSSTVRRVHGAEAIKASNGFVIGSNLKPCLWTREMS
jgi:hypothetical protein